MSETKSSHPSELEAKRHSLAHLLAAAVTATYPAAQLTIGPAVDNGFYYDIDFGAVDFGTSKKALSEEDFPTIEAKMHEILKEWKLSEKKGSAFLEKEVSAEDAETFFAENPYKLELIKEIAERGEKITLFVSGAESKVPFTDLCRGGHVESMQDIDPDSFKLSKIAGAYWRGDEKNKMLTRIYGLAFHTKEELAAYEAMQEEAKKRDHRKLGKDLDLFAISELVGGGLPLFTPKGTILRETLSSYSQELQASYGFERVWTPHMARTELYKYSGHFDKYPERFEVTSAESSDVFMLKPMNCPHHAQLFARKPWSYRELPVRYMENTTNYRDEKHGELHGLSRVRSLSQDDGHVFCQESHCENEFRNIINMIKKLYGALGLDYYVRLSFRDDSDKFLGDADMWKRAEAIVEKVAKEENLVTVPGIGEAAFYGPKLDYLVRDALGREWQCATIQLDFVQPERFGLSYIDSDGKEKRPVMIHKALLGSIERFISVYIEHTAGVFPLWLSPLQVKVVPIGERQLDYATGIFKAMQEAGIRVEIDLSNESLGKKIRAAKTEKIPYTIVIGDKEMESQRLTVETRGGEKLEGLSVDEFISKIKTEIAEKS